VNTEWEVTPRYPGPIATIGEVWRHRHLVRFVGDRALRRLYKRTILGWLWLFINPLFPIALNTLIFGALLAVTSDGLPYFLFLMAGTVAWDTFAATLMRGTRALEMNRDLTEQIYHPRALLPFGSIAPAMLTLVIRLSVFILALVYYALHDRRLYLRTDTGLLWALAALALGFAFALAISYFTSIWGENTRDTRFALNQVLSVWNMLTPVVYPLSQVPDQYKKWILLNPMAIVLETFKWGLFGVGQLDARTFGVTAAAVAVLFVSGLMYFTWSEARTIAER